MAAVLLNRRKRRVKSVWIRKCRTHSHIHIFNNRISLRINIIIIIANIKTTHTHKSQAQLYDRAIKHLLWAMRLQCCAVEAYN